MRPADGNPLDLNNLPPREDHTSGGEGYGVRKNSCREKDESGKVYKCRFCSLKFCKSQALGGHMNRHRQERETETLNRARQLVFTNDNIIPPPPPPHHLVSGVAVPGGGYHSHHESNDQHRSVYDHPAAARMFTGAPSPSTVPPHAPPHSYMYNSWPLAQYYNIDNSAQHMNNNEYLIGHVLPGTNPKHPNFSHKITNHFTCIGAPVGQLGGGTGDMSSSLHHLAEPSSIINRY